MQFILIMGDLGQENGCFIPYFAHCFQLFSFLWLEVWTNDCTNLTSCL